MRSLSHSEKPEVSAAPLSGKDIMRLLVEKRKECWNRIDGFDSPKYYQQLIERLKKRKMFQEINWVDAYGLFNYRKGRRFAYNFLKELIEKAFSEVLQNAK